MKRIMRKNQVIITVLAVMIAIAGYLTYAGRVEVADSRDISMENTSDIWLFQKPNTISSKARILSPSLKISILVTSPSYRFGYSLFAS